MYLQHFLMWGFIAAIFALSASKFFSWYSPTYGEISSELSFRDMAQLTKNIKKLPHRSTKYNYWLN